jgi:hypothetical protein
MSSETLRRAKADKADEFYTQYDTIEKEVEVYGDYWKDKFVFCNCDNPRWSNFFKYFALNFNKLGLRKLVATHYTDAVGTKGTKPLFAIKTVDPSTLAYKIEVNEVVGEYEKDDPDSIIEHILKSDKNSMVALKGSGSFSSTESKAVLKECDVVVTNPPFSLFSSFIRTLLNHKVDFLVIGNVNAILYPAVFDRVKAGTIRFGKTMRKGGAEFRIPDHYVIRVPSLFRFAEDGTRYAKLGFCRWFTNIKPAWYPEPLNLEKKYTPEAYPDYDNFDGINVNVTDDIPCDYFERMGVPVTFFDKYNPDQFEIIGRTGYDVLPTKRYSNAKLVTVGDKNEDGDFEEKVQPSNPNGSACVVVKEKPDSNYYISDGTEGYLISHYSRIIIRRKQK